MTSVGATAFKSSDGKTVDSEHTASIVDGAIITTGGGFSALSDTPAWQKRAVSQWATGAPAAVKPPANSYDTSKRGYPDVSLNGHNYQVGANMLVLPLFVPILAFKISRALWAVVSHHLWSCPKIKRRAQRGFERGT